MRRIVAAAINCGLFIGMLPPPGRHPDIALSLESEGVVGAYSYEKGFIDSDGYYLTREQAYPVALAAGQIVSKDPTEMELYTEDLW